MDIKGFEVKAAIFDLDGTIADSLDVWNDIDERFFANHGKVLPETYQNDVQALDFAAAATYTKKLMNLSQSEEEIMDEWRKMSVDEYASKINLKTGAVQFLKKLHKNGVRLGLATASGEELFKPLLEKYDVYSLFSSCVTTTESGKSKESPDVYLLCAEKLGFKPCKCMVFEDILPGILSAKSAGMSTCGVYDVHSKKDEKEIIRNSCLYIESFEDLL